MYDLEFEKLTESQLYDKIATLNKQLYYYRFKGNDQVVESILTMLDICYNIRDERNFKRLYDSITPPDGVIIDPETHGKKEPKQTRNTRKR